MASEPRPMDPERLRHLRRFIEQQAENPHNSIARQLAELLADRDYQAQRADEAEERAKVAAVKCLEHFDECTALRLRVREAESAMAEETRRAEHMQHERDEYAADNEAWRSEARRLRSRVRVEAEDVERAGVTQARVEEWFTRSKAWARVETPDSRTSSWAWRGNGSVIIVGCDSAEYLADRIGWIAKYENRSGLDILDEMAAASVEEPGPRTSDPDYWDDAAKSLQLTRAKCEAWLGANGWVRATSPRAKAASEWRNAAMHITVFLHDDPSLLLAALAGITPDKSELGRILDEMARMEVPK